MNKIKTATVGNPAMRAPGGLPFPTLLGAIPGVEALNFGENVSPEGLTQGFTHSLTMKFASSLDRDSIYLPHPIHQKFVELFVPNTKSVLVYDYWE